MRGPYDRSSERVRWTLMITGLRLVHGILVPAKLPSGSPGHDHVKHGTESMVKVL
jgi:hypothetical protein